MLNKLLNLPDVSDQQGLQGEELDNFKEKCNKAEKTFENGGIYICPVCDGESQMCDDDYQSLECEYLERAMLGDRYYENWYDKLSKDFCKEKAFQQEATQARLEVWAKTTKT